jgi:hypothetical protein
MGRGVVGRNAALLVVVGLLLHAGGCGSGVGAATEEAARDALKSALDSWKSGRKAEDMRNESPEVIVGDSDWKHGRRLVGYEIAGSGSFDGKNLRVPVKLTLAHPPRGNRTVIANYIVGTQPVVTLFRDAEE